ncbi:MAG: hypothetical protein Q4F81_03285 [Eubacteriales bacterium]|nr:hypothetical protein [Eubacteriales bacterium]
MKHTMKKLLCMALAIMLLVSAVPVFAAAENDLSATVVFNLFNKAGTTQVGTQNVSVNFSNDGTTVANLLTYGKLAVPDGYQGVSEEDLAKQVYNGQSVSVSAYAIQDPEVKHYVNVIVKLDGVAQSAVAKEIAGTETTVGNLIKYKITQDLSDYKFVQAWNGTSVLSSSDVVYENQTIEFAFEKIKAEVAPIKVIVKVGTSDNVVGTVEKVPANGVSAKVADLLTYAWSSDWDNVYTFDHAYSEAKGNVAQTDSVNAGDTLYVMLKKGTTTTETPTTSGNLSLVITVNGSEKCSKTVQNFTTSTVSNLIKKYLDSDWTTGYGFNQVTINSVTYYRSDIDVKAGDTVKIELTRKASKDNSNKVYLHVYLNGDASTIALTKDITGTYLMDDWYTDTTEVLNYLKNNYYTAKDSSNAVTIDGLYTNINTSGAFPANYYADNKVASLSDIDEKLEDGYVHISVMLKNAKAKSSSTADSSNPKTGDTIFVPVMVMGLTGTVLAAAYVFGKKRFAR